MLDDDTSEAWIGVKQYFYDNHFFYFDSHDILLEWMNVLLNTRFTEDENDV